MLHAASIALAVSLTFGASTSQLPPTQPGTGPNEGVFLVTSGDESSPAIYFIAANQRHSILPADLQQEQRLNPLWPVRFVDLDTLLAFPEGAPIGAARTGLLDAPPPPAASEQDNEESDPSVVGEPTTYTVRRGDSAIAIARKFGVDVDALLAANGIANRNRIYAGQVLTIPNA